MQVEEFKRKYGQEWRKFQARPIYAALLDTMREASPRESSPDRKPGDIVVGGQILYAEIKGYETCLRLIHRVLGEEEKPPKQPDDYAQTLDQQLNREPE